MNLSLICNKCDRVTPPASRIRLIYGPCGEMGCDGVMVPMDDVQQPAAAALPAAMARVNEAATALVGSLAHEALHPDFGDPETLLNSRAWLQRALEAKGAKIVGGGIGMGQCDLDFTLDGCTFTFNVSLRPLIRKPHSTWGG